MSAFKIKHKATGKFISTTAIRHIWLYFIPKYKDRYPIEKALVPNNGKVYSTKTGAENFFKLLKQHQEEFEIVELK